MCPGTGQQDPAELVGTTKPALQACVWPGELGRAHSPSTVQHLQNASLSCSLILPDKVSRTRHVAQKSQSPQEMWLGGNLKGSLDLING